MTRASDDIEVDLIRTNFYWPMSLQAIRHTVNTATADQEAAYLKKQFYDLQKTGLWQPVKDTLQHLKKNDGSIPSHRETRHNAQAYGEFLFFHDFVQRALFGSTSNPNSTHPMMMLSRDDVKALHVAIAGTQWRLSVERLTIMLVRPGIAVLCVQVSSETEQNCVSTDGFFWCRPNLSQVLKFNDAVRRTHLPFIDEDGAWPYWKFPHWVVPKHVRWSSSLHGKDGQSFDLKDVFWPPEHGGKKPIQDVVAAMPAAERQVDPFPHWMWLLDGGKGAFHLTAGSGRDFYWRSFSDERMPITTTIILNSRDDYYRLDGPEGGNKDYEGGNWMRIAFVDGPGSDPHPYNPAFVSNSFAGHCYDRYHHKRDAVADAPVRYLMCDYALSAVTYRQDKGERIFINHYAETIAIHMQRHYHQLFLTCVVDKAVMLHLSSRISRAVEGYDKRFLETKSAGLAEDELAEDMQDIERDFLHYVHRFRFTGVSGQLQPSEIHAQLRKVMNLDAIYVDIKNELETAVQFLATREERRSANAAERLNIIATIGLILALVMGFFSMNIITEKDIMLAPLNAASQLAEAAKATVEQPKTQLIEAAQHTIAQANAQRWLGIKWFGGGLAICSLVAFLISCFMSWQANGQWNDHNKSVKATRVALFVLFGLGLFAWLLASSP